MIFLFKFSDENINSVGDKLIKILAMNQKFGELKPPKLRVLPLKAIPLQFCFEFDIWKLDLNHEAIYFIYRILYYILYFSCIIKCCYQLQLGTTALFWLGVHGSISRTFYAQLFTKIQSSCPSFFRFWDLHL